LIANIQDTQTTISAMKLSKHIPIGNSDAGAYFNTKVLAAIEYGVGYLLRMLTRGYDSFCIRNFQMANVHPWFGNVSIGAAAGWTWDFFETTDVAATSSLSPPPQMYIAETGWPSVKPFGYVSPN
jgi:hypothetical protein